MTGGWFGLFFGPKLNSNFTWVYGTLHEMPMLEGNEHAPLPTILVWKKGYQGLTHIWQLLTWVEQRMGVFLRGQLKDTYILFRGWMQQPGDGWCCSVLPTVPDLGERFICLNRISISLNIFMLFSAIFVDGWKAGTSQYPIFVGVLSLIFWKTGGLISFEGWHSSVLSMPQSLILPVEGWRFMFHVQYQLVD